MEPSLDGGKHLSRSSKFISALLKLLITKSHDPPIASRFPLFVVTVLMN